MAKINIDDLNQGKKLTAEDMTQVKGGGGYIKIGDIKGECEVAASAGPPVRTYKVTYNDKG